MFDMPDYDGHEAVHWFHDAATGYRGLIAIHNSALGPACGGTRMWAYADANAALTDALRLSKGMSYKNAMAELPLGGGKSVIIGDARKDKTASLMRAHGRAVDSLNGRYVTAMDVGMTEADMETLASVTPHVAGYAQKGKTGGDPSPMTAWGVFCGIKAAVKAALGTDDLNGIRVAIQGVGNVGYDTALHLKAAGATLTVADVNETNVKRATETLGATVVATDVIHAVEADVFAPCALGAILNDQTIPALKVKVVAGGANNQLAKPAIHGAKLAERGILYAPDYVINGGGIIRVCGQIYDWSDEAIRAKTERIGVTLAEVFAAAKAENRPTHEVADRIARGRIEAASQKKAAA
ncbi:Leucine dehydrogenase [Alphaproteobacteria bacterium SO-S41]|nr:Leucine dehydrogenase [Alphaproteobacteria bacterium SO-S41]